MVCPRIISPIVGVGLVAALASSPAPVMQSGQENRGLVPTVSQVTTPGSASTLLTAITSTRETGRQIEALIVWRGTPGWYLKGSQRSSGGGTPTSFSASFEYGDVSLQVTLVLAPGRALTIQDRSVDLGAKNVVLIDNTDSAAGPEVIRTLQIDGSLSDPRRLSPAIASSSEVVQFLRCEVQLDSPRAQATIGAICDELSRRR